MAGHYCIEHETEFFKRGGMKNYAHPLKDEAGETAGWCSEPKEGGAPIPEGASTQQFKADPDKTKSIERQVALKSSVQLAVAERITADKVLSYAEVFYRYLSGDITVKDEDVFQALLKKTFIVKDK